MESSLTRARYDSYHLSDKIDYNKHNISRTFNTTAALLWRISKGKTQ